MKLNTSFDIYCRAFKGESVSKCLKIYIVYAISSNLLRLLTTVISYENFYELKQFPLEMLNQGLLSLLALFVFIKETKLNGSEIFITTLQIYLCISFSVSYEEENIIHDPFQSFHLMLLPLLTNINWKYSSVSAFFVNLFNIITLFRKNESTTQLLWLKIASYLLSFTFISLGAFTKQRLYQQIFSKAETDNTSLIYLQNLIKKVLPSSIVVLRNEKIVFQNLHTRRLLRCPVSMDMEVILNKIIINEVKIDSDCNIFEEFEANVPTLRLLDYLKDFRKKKDTTYGFQELTAEIEEFDNLNMYDNISQLTRLIKIKIATILWEGEEALIVIMSEDYQREKLIQLSNQAKYKDQMLATVSHDLRTPLNGVIGMLEMVIDLIPDREMRKSLTIALRSSRLLLFMINDILDFNLMANGKLRLNLVVFDIVQCVKDVSKLIKFQAKRKGLLFKVETKFFSSDTCLIRSDPNRLKQVILNLLGNALKFTQKGIIKVILEPLDSPSGIKISVEDSGTGIKKEDIPKLFKVFGRLEGRENDKFNANGIGLGLEISQSLVKKLNNSSEDEIKVESEFGKGSVFYFILRDLKVPSKPRSVISVDAEELEENYALKSLHQMRFNTFQEHNHIDSAHIQAKSNSKFQLMQVNSKKLKIKNILVADDDQINIMVFSSYLSTFTDCKFDFAFNGQHALDLILERASEDIFYDLIFMDCNMPIMDGFAASLKIIQMEKQNLIPHVPIIASTANISQSDHEKCFKHGMVDLLTKPFGKKSFREKIDKYCG